MTEIPPHLPASAAQSSVQAREVAKERDARRAGQADAVNRQVKAVDEAGSTVETTDDDVAVFGDSEGTGSEGRELEDGNTPAPESPADGTKNGITRDEHGRFHVDLEA